jgi:hypothetical protein
VLVFGGSENIFVIQIAKNISCNIKKIANKIKKIVNSQNFFISSRYGSMKSLEIFPCVF